MKKALIIATLAICILLSINVYATEIVETISAGFEHSVYLSSDGTVWQWGNGASKPIKRDDISDVVKVTSGCYHNLAIKTDGTVVVWERYNNSPIIMPNLTNVADISVSYSYLIALKKDGTVWYSNQFGGYAYSTFQKAEGLTDIIAVDTGYCHFLALKSDGTVYTWGSNYNGELGNGSIIDNPIPAKVNGLNNIISISSDGYHSLALKSDGTVWAWGANNSGQSGDGSTANTLIPKRVPNLLNIVSIGTGEAHSLAVNSQGKVFSWGFNNNGQLGNGTTQNAYLPIEIQGMDNVKTVAGGGYHTLAIKNDSTLWSWGGNWARQLGVGSVEQSLLTPNEIKFTELNEIIVTDANKLQSNHPYADYEFNTWVYTVAGAEGLDITFSTDTNVEENYDYIYILDKNNTQIGKYTGTNLAGKTISVSGDTVKIRLMSDEMVVCYGFRVTEVVPVIATGPIVNLKAITINKTSAILSFSQPNDAIDVVLQLSTNGGQTWNNAETSVALNSNSTKATAINLQQDTAYKFRLVVTGGEREGISNIVEAKTLGQYSAESDFIFDDVKGVITGYKGQGGDVYIPPTIDGKSVKIIGENSFRECKTLTSVVIPEGITEIGVFAFFNCSSLSAISVPNSVTYIGHRAFLGTAWLEQAGDFAVIGNGILVAYQGNDDVVNIPNNVKTISECAFQNLPIKSVFIPNTLKSIGGAAFDSCGNLSSINIPDSVLEIGEWAFYNCNSLRTLIIPKSVTFIGYGAFEMCNNLTIECFESSFAQEYATKNGIKFIIIQENNTGIPNIKANFNNYVADGINKLDIFVDANSNNCPSASSVMIAIYKNNKLIKTKVQSLSSLNDTQIITFSMDLAGNSNEYTAKILAWEQGTIKPLINPIEYPAKPNVVYSGQVVGINKYDNYFIDRNQSNSIISSVPQIAKDEVAINSYFGYKIYKLNGYNADDLYQHNVKFSFDKDNNLTMLSDGDNNELFEFCSTNVASINSYLVYGEYELNNAVNNNYLIRFNTAMIIVNNEIIVNPTNADLLPTAGKIKVINGYVIIEKYEQHIVKSVNIGTETTIATVDGVNLTYPNEFAFELYGTNTIIPVSNLEPRDCIVFIKKEDGTIIKSFVAGNGFDGIVVEKNLSDYSIIVNNKIYLVEQNVFNAISLGGHYIFYIDAVGTVIDFDLISN